MKAQGDPDKNDKPVHELFDLSTFLEQQLNLDDSLRELAVMAAEILDTENCSIMLLKDEEGSDEPTLRIFAHSGYLPEAAHTEARKLKDGVSGYVAATGESLLVEDIERSPFAPLKRGRYRSTGFIAVPIVIQGKVVGVINANTPRSKQNVDKRDLELLTAIALLISKSIQVIHLQNLLRSRYAQFALAHEKAADSVTIPTAVLQNPDSTARILAKTFYSEMTKAGFGPDHILATASEIISLLTEKLKRHGDRAGRLQEKP